MRNWNTSVACALLALASTAVADTNTATGAKKNKMGKQPVMMNNDQINWGEAPPDLPKGAQMAVLHGDPTKKGMFTLRVKMPDGYKVPPHWHTNDEELTILSGVMMMRMGDSMTSEPHLLTEGAYHYLPGKTHHSAEAKGDVVLQVHSTGPFDIHYVNAEDNPNPKGKTSKTARR